LPQGFEPSLIGVESFLKSVVDCTADLVVAYKPNISFFEAHGIDGLRVLERICKYIPSTIPIILDAKRGDIGNTSKMQARYLFDYFNASATTLHPYMGEDSLTPFFDYKDRFNFVLALTSNSGAMDFECLILNDGRPLYRHVLDQLVNWNHAFGNVGAVVGATQDVFSELSTRYSSLSFLVPGVGAQGGRYQDVVANQVDRNGMLIVNVGRAILYAASHAPIEQSIRDAILVI